jgi:predicted protein tyrosine phosphatase
MIREIFAKSREFMLENLDSLLAQPGCLFISVIDQHAEPVFEDLSNVLTLRFDDVSPDLCGGEELFYQRCAEMKNLGRPFLLLSDEMAATIISFLHRNEACNVLYVHCTLGVSRSGAIATFAAELFGLNVLENSPQIVPNQLVLETLRRCY